MSKPKNQKAKTGSNESLDLFAKAIKNTINELQLIYYSCPYNAKVGIEQHINYLQTTLKENGYN